MLSQLKKIYDNLPKDKLKILKYIPDKILFGNSYLSSKNKISFDKKIIDKNLLEILNYSRINTQFGKDHIPNNLTIQNVRKVLENIPLVSSLDLSKNLDYYISSEYKNKKSYLATTGGTGRNPTSILLSNKSFGIEWAHIHNIWSLAGYKKSKHLKLSLRGKSLKDNKLIEFNPVYNELVVDTFKVNNTNFKQFIDEIKKYNIQYIHGYPSLIKEFITYFKKHDYTPNIKGIFLGSEGATVSEKKQMKDFFNCKVIHWYGQTEKVALAVDIEANGMFRVYTSYGYPRVVDGELISTSFVNYALPLINYKMGDGAEIIEDDKYIYLNNIQSRRGKDFVYLSEDKKYSLTGLKLHSILPKDILLFQIHQYEYGNIDLKIVPSLNKNKSIEEIEKVFCTHISKTLQGVKVNIIFSKEHEIIKSHRGKMILLVQDLI